MLIIRKLKEYAYEKMILKEYGSVDVMEMEG